MSISSEISRISGNIADAYTAANSKGATMPVTQDSDNLAATIATISSGSSSAVISAITVTPSTSSQTITATSGVDGYSPITVNAVTSAIDSNIAASNIKSGVTILGVTGNITELNGNTLNVTPTTSSQTIAPTSPYNAFTSVNVSAVTSAIDSSIVASNIKSGVTILGVTGDYEGIQPSGTLPITSNGTYDVTNYASAAVNVPSSAPAYYKSWQLSSSGVLLNDAGVMDFSQIKDIGQGVLKYAFQTGVSGLIDLSSLEDVSGSEALSHTFETNGAITSVNLSSLKDVSASSGMESCFRYCGVTSVDLSSLKNVSGGYGLDSCFENCPITNVDLSSLEDVSGEYGMNSCFAQCQITNLNLPKLKKAMGIGCFTAAFSSSGIVNADLSKVEICGHSAFDGAFQGNSNLATLNMESLAYCYGDNCLAGIVNNSGLTSISFDSLKYIAEPMTFYYSFVDCRQLTDIYLPALTEDSFGSTNTDQFNEMFNDSVDGCTVHFPSNLNPQSGSTVISDLEGYPDFSGTNILLAYDLPSTNHLIGANTVEYERSPKSDTATALAWRVKDTGTLPNVVIDWTPFYTNGTSDPAVSDTIYSDAACTTAVTTISSIA